MRALVQRVRETDLFVNGELISHIGKGVLVFIGLSKDDTDKDTQYFLKKIPQLRIFEDENGKMNLNVLQAGGEILLVSQFTLFADTSHGNRPSFIDAMEYSSAQPVFQDMVDQMNRIVTTKSGIFGADMKIDAKLDGPVTILMDSRK